MYRRSLTPATRLASVLPAILGRRCGALNDRASSCGGGQYDWSGRWLATRPKTHIHLARRRTSIVDLNRAGHAGRKNDIGGHLIDMDANRDALGQAYPGEDGIDVSDPLTVGLRVRDVDCAGDAVDVSAHDLIAAHQLDLSRISHPDRTKVRLLEISVDPE